MAHVPHLLVSGAWSTSTVAVSTEQQRHLTRVLRRAEGDPVSYSDGAGRRGIGVWTGEAIERGDEAVDPPPSPDVTLAVAPPDNKDRQRFVVEKAAEIGVRRLRWLRTVHGEGRLPRPERADAWMRAAIEQSRRSWIMEIDSEWVEIDQLEQWVAADAGGGPLVPADRITVAIGPEGGWADDELPADTTRVSLGDGTLRTETAAIVAAAWAVRPHLD